MGKPRYLNAPHLKHFMAEIDRLKADGEDGRAIVDAIVASELGSAGFRCGAYWMSLAGVNVTCTSGHDGLLRNWQNAARRKIDEAQGGACPGHIASETDAKVCARCGIHIIELRPDDDDGDGFNPHGSGPVPIEPRDGPTFIRGSKWYVGRG